MHDISNFEHFIIYKLSYKDEVSERISMYEEKIRRNMFGEPIPGFYYYHVHKKALVTWGLQNIKKNNSDVCIFGLVKVQCF